MMMEKFIKFLGENGVNRNFELSKTSDENIKDIGSYFGVDLYQEIQLEKEKIARDKELKSKFNGKIVMDCVPDLEGKQLGDFIKSFRAQFSDTTLVSMDAEDIKNQILIHLKQTK